MHNKRIFIYILSGMLFFSGALTVFAKDSNADLSAQSSSTASDSDIAVSNSSESTPIVSSEATQTDSLGLENFPDQETLEQAYIQHRSSSASSARRYSRRINAGSRLTGQDKLIYDRCKTQLQKVADGVDEDGDRRIEAIVTIPASELLKISAGSKLVEDPSNNRTYITASDLGITQRITRSTLAISNQAVSALFNYDIRAIVQALLADCPYDLYWFDKEQNVNRTTQPYYSVTTASDGIQRICFDNTRSTVSIRFVVSSDYAATSRGDSDTNARYTVDASKTGAAVLASANARQIVKETESQGLSDLQILRQYQQKICELTDYDYDASPTQPYGNPWQMVYVFDNEPMTKVTCEGYAKAMQYLCDETDFHDNSITCASVTGYLIYHSSIESHMWNIVHWTDGNNYLVDVTNCDSGTAGEGGKLFMIPVRSETADSLPDDLAERLREMAGTKDPVLYSATVNAGTSSEQTLYYAYDTSATQTFSADQLSVFKMDLSVSSGIKDSSETEFTWNESGLNDGNGYTLTIQNGTSVNVSGTSAAITLPAGKYTATLSETDLLGRNFISSPFSFEVKETKKTDTSKNAADSKSSADTISGHTDADAASKTDISAVSTITKKDVHSEKASDGSAQSAAAAKRTETAAVTKSEKSADTGDHTQLVVYSVAAVLAALCLALVLIVRKRKD